MLNSIREFLRLESASGLLLILAACLAMLAENSPLDALYDSLLGTPVEIRIGAFQIDKPLLLWINDGLMAVFFFLIGLEVKREVLQGELSSPARVALPAIAAVGGMSVPAVIYASLNWHDPIAIDGWAIPSATDIAFALGILSLLGRRVPNSLKIFLLTLAIFDDLGAIVIIALFYTEGLSMGSLMAAVVFLGFLYFLNRRGVLSIVPYVVVGVMFWAAVLKSGVHATLAGVLLAFFIPLRVPSSAGKPPLLQIEHDLHPTVSYFILPVFAFANTGVSLDGFSLDSLLHPVPLGIALGLFFGNQIGVFGFSWLAIKLGWCRLPKRVGWLELYGTSILCGIGFTMSLFISSLAFHDGVIEGAANDRLGILAGTLLSATVGYCVLRYALHRKKKKVRKLGLRQPSDGKMI